MSAKTPYIGSKISLISKAEIRYEGVLYAVDTKEATVTLAKVRSFGTESRQVPKPIPPRTDTYEFIIFRGSDIKDLHVSEIQGKTDDPGPQDPAILSATSHIPVPPSPATNEPPSPSSSSAANSTPIVPPPIQQPYSPFAPAPSGFNPFSVPYFKPNVMMGGGGGAPGGVGGSMNLQRPPILPLPPAAQHTMHHPPLPLSAPQPFPPYLPGQLPIPLAQKSPFVPLPVSSSTVTAPPISTIMRPSPAAGKSQSPVASSTPHGATGGLAPESQPSGGIGTTSPAQAISQMTSETESPLARMNHIPPSSQVVTQAPPPPPPSLISQIPPSSSTTTSTMEAVPHSTASVNGNQQQLTQVHTDVEEEKESLKKGGDAGEAPLINDSNHPPQSGAERRNSGSGSRGRERSRGRGGRRSFRGVPRSGSRGAGSSNKPEPTYRYENDFDFESANAQFDKQVLEEEFKKLRVSKSKSGEGGGGGGGGTTRSSVSEEVVGEGEEEEVEEGEIVEEEEPDIELYYDKSKSFFDNISCDNPTSGNRFANNWNEERELNTETFGVSSVNRLRRGRGRYRGGRGRGRGRGGYYRRDYYYYGGRGGGGGYRGRGRGGRRDDDRAGGGRNSGEGRSGGREGGSGYYRSYYRGRGGKRGGGYSEGGSGRESRQATGPTSSAGEEVTVT